jgi:hypothetical protein
VLSLLSVFLLAAAVPAKYSWLWAGLYAVLGVLLPLLFLFLLLSKQEVSDIELTNRKQRIVPLAVTIVGIAVSWWLMDLGLAPRPMQNLVLTYGCLALIVFLISHSWKISMHCATVGVVGSLVWELLGHPWPLVFGGLVMVAARCWLQRHNLSQAVAGLTLGCFLYWLIGT